MARRGKMMIGMMVAMLVASLLLAIAATYAASGVGPNGYIGPYEYCSTQCCRMCLSGSCCGWPEHCYLWEHACIRRCDEYHYGPNQCLSGWYCTGTTCSTGGCCQ